jgi:pyruvate/2-oxoglutarate/acetoin dehydrogenase E1 component
MVEAQKGTGMLQKAGVSVEFIDLRTLNPTDTETLVKSVQRWIPAFARVTQTWIVNFFK